MHCKTIINSIVAIVLSTSLCMVDVCPAFAQNASAGLGTSTAVTVQSAKNGANEGSGTKKAAYKSNSDTTKGDRNVTNGSGLKESGVKESGLKESGVKESGPDESGLGESSSDAAAKDAPANDASANESSENKTPANESSADEIAAGEPLADKSETDESFSDRSAANGSSSDAPSPDENEADAACTDGSAADESTAEEPAADGTGASPGTNTFEDNSTDSSQDTASGSAIDEAVTDETGEEPGAASDSSTAASAADSATTAPAEPMIDQEMIIEQEMEVQSVIPDDTTGLTEDELFSGYAEGVFGIDEAGSSTGSNSGRRSGSGNSRALTKAGDKLEGVNKSIYNEIGAELPVIAAGNRAETTFDFTIENKDQVQLAFTAQELGLDSLFTTDETGSQVVSSEARKAADTRIRALMSDISLNSVVSALLADFPFELYWYNKTVNTRRVYSLKLIPDADEGGNRFYRLGFDGTYSVNLPVSADYASNYDYSNPSQNYQVNTAIGQSVQTAVARAR